TVRRFDEEKGYGFIRQDDGTDVFVHFSDIAGKGFRTLNKGDVVSFDVTQGAKGPRAMNVQIESAASAGGAGDLDGLADDAKLAAAAGGRGAGATGAQGVEPARGAKDTPADELDPDRAVQER